MPSNTYIEKSTKSTPCHKTAKDRLTLLLGRFAFGDCKLIKANTSVSFLTTSMCMYYTTHILYYHTLPTVEIARFRVNRDDGGEKD